MRRGLNLVLVGVTALPMLVFFAVKLRAFPSPPEEHPAPQQALAIVVNWANPIDSLTLDELRRIFLGERGHWANGRRITLVMMEPGHLERKAILRDVCQMNETDYSNRILHGLFTGELFVSPKTLASPTGVRKFVFNVPGAIGYVRENDVDETVKVLRINGKLPEDKDYPLHIEHTR